MLEFQASLLTRIKIAYTNTSFKVKVEDTGTLGKGIDEKTGT